MTGSYADENLSVSTAGQVDAQAAAWLRQRNTEWDEQRQADFDAWLAKSTAHQIAFWRLEAAWERSSRLEALRKTPMPYRPAPVSSARWSRGLRIAAAVAAAAAVVTALANWPHAQETTYATALGERKVVTLGDGSRIELNTNTTLRLAASRDGRMAVLEKGEAFFQIEHDAAHPFVVIAGKHRITDLGTQFVARQTANNLQVTLVEGSAEVGPLDERDHERSVVLKPGDVALATASSVAVLKKPASVVNDELAWRKGMLVFDRTTLADAAAEFNRYNDTHLIVEDKSIATRTIGGKFSTNDVKGFVEIMQQLIGLRVKRQGKDFVISH